MMKKTVTVKIHFKKPRRKRPGVHSKRKASKCKQSKNYLKRKVGQ
jgi:hypothetical protein